MQQEKYVYNQQTLQYERVKLNSKDKFIRIAGFASSVIFTALAIFVIAYLYFPSPKEQSLQREIDQMKYVYSNLTNQYDNISQDVNELHQKDSEVHRLVFGMDPMDDGIWEGGIGGHDQNKDIFQYSRSGEVLSTLNVKVNKLKRKINLQQLSLDTIYQMAVEREEKLASIPSIKPVREDKLKRKIRYMSGFGYRIHPVHKLRKFHKGIDFTAPTGTAIQATGNGKVVKIEKRRFGYGNNVKIDHGYGYTTLYAHMHTIDVKKGDIVTKGQMIGTVGSTGTSTAPHLHYEVHLNGKAVNPIDYCLDGLSPEEYQVLLNKANEENQSFD